MNVKELLFSDNIDNICLAFEISTSLTNEEEEIFIKSVHERAQNIVDNDEKYVKLIVEILKTTSLKPLGDAINKVRI